MSDKVNNYAEETKPLFRLLRTEAFRFIIVRYNDHSLIEKLKGDLKEYFPDRQILSVDARWLDYRSLVNRYYELRRGFYFIENFEVILNNPEIYSGLNQRRDKLAKYPIAMIVLISVVQENQFVRIIMEKIPDLWSFRSLILDLKIITSQLSLMERSEIDFSNSDINYIRPYKQETYIESKKKELKNLLERSGSRLFHEDDLAIILYYQIAQLYSELGDYQKAIEYFKKTSEKNESNKDYESLILTYKNLAEIYGKTGDLDKSLEYYLKSETIKLEILDKTGLVDINNNIGAIYSKKKNWEKAQEYYRKSEKILLEVGDKAGLAFTLFNLGTVLQQKGDQERGDQLIILAGFIVINQGLKYELQQMAWALEPLLKKLGEKKFMETGELLYEERVLQRKD